MNGHSTFQFSRFGTSKSVSKLRSADEMNLSLGKANPTLIELVRRREN